MNIIKLLDRPIAFHRCLVDAFGSINAALLLGQAIYWQNRCTSDDGWWWKTSEQWMDEIGMSWEKLKTARDACEGVLLHELRGLPAKSFYRVDQESLLKKLESSMVSVSVKSDVQVSGKAGNCDPGKPETNCTETTSETSLLFPDGNNTGSGSSSSSSSKQKPGSSQASTSKGQEGSAKPPTHPGPKLPSQVVQLEELWCAAYLKRFGNAYVITSYGKDRTAYKRLMAATQLPPDEIIKIAIKAWDLGTWEGDKAKDPSCLLSFWNKITDQIKKKDSGVDPAVPAWKQKKAAEEELARIRKDGVSWTDDREQMEAESYARNKRIDELEALIKRL